MTKTNNKVNRQRPDREVTNHFAEKKFRKEKITYPEDTVSGEVDALVGDPPHTAIEHTLVELFNLELECKENFKRAGFTSSPYTYRTLSGFSIGLGLSCDTFQSRKGEDWEELGKEIRKWFNESLESFPEGYSSHQINTSAGFITACIHKSNCGDTFTYHEMLVDGLHQMTIEKVIKKAISSKVPKLLRKHPEKKKILLIEVNNPSISPFEIALDVHAELKRQYPLEDVEIWFAWNSGQGLIIFQKFDEYGVLLESLQWHQKESYFAEPSFPTTIVASSTA